jgi:hypothetical protein
MHNLSKDSIAPWLKEFCSSHKDSLIRQANDIIRDFLKLYETFPEEYGWRVTDEAAIQEQMRSMRNPTATQINEIYWQDMARQIEAYYVMLTFRSGEIASDGLKLLNERRYLSAAFCARSMLELACYSIYNLNIVNATVTNVLSKVNAEPETVCISQELEAIIVKMLWATRLGEPLEHLKQVNVLTFIKKVAEHPNATFVTELYDFLCDIAHPNVVGNAKFWAKVDSHYPDGSFRLKISRKEESEISDLLLENIIKAIGWSAACILGGFGVGRDTVQAILRRWPINKAN